MAFKIKDGVQIGTVNVFNNAGTLLVNAPTATVLATARTIAISGAVTGTATSFNGGANITISATALAAGNLSGTIPSAVLGSSTIYIGTTAVALNRATAALSLTGVSIDGNAGTVTNGVVTTGSYADPAWITSLAKSKVGLGSVENTALSTWAGSSNITTIGAATATSLVVSGNLVVNGTTTTVNSTTVTLDDPTITLGGDTAPATDDSKDRGIEFRWHNGISAYTGFFGFDRSSGKFTFIPNATNASEVFSGAKGTIDANIEWADILNKPVIGAGSVTSVGLTVPTGLTVSGSPITTSGTLAITLTSGYSIPTTTSQTNWDTAYADRNKWDGGATGLVAATGRTSLGATTVGGNLFTLTNPGAITFLRVNADNTVSTLDAASFRTAIGAQASGSYLTSYTETDTLATVTGRGATTATALTITNATNTTSSSTGALVITGGLAVNANVYVKGTFLDANSAGTIISARDTVQTTVAATAATAVDTWAIASYRAVKYLVQITQGTNYQFSEIVVVHNGTTTTMTEYAVVETNGALGTFTADISAGNARLLVAMGTATSATINIQRTLMVI
jgi:hypothetical protein